MGVSTAWVDDDYTSATTGWNVDHFATINGAVQAINAGGTINVFPGNYIEAAPNSYLYDAAGPYTFGLFLAVDGVTVQGVDAFGTPITSYAGVVANVRCDADNNFGPSGVFIQGSNVTISGLNIFQNSALGLNKTIEVIGDAATVKYCRLTDGCSLYINDWRYNAGTNISWVKSYTVIGNQFTDGTSLDLCSGAGFTGPASSRQILNNSFELAGSPYWGINFTGTGSGVPWFVYGVGGAVITGNSFSGGTVQYIRVRGDHDSSQFNWPSYFANNTFDRSVVAGANPSVDLREYSYTSGAYVFNHCRRIGATIQGEIGNAVAGDIVKAGPGTYTEAVAVNKHIDLIGAGSGTNPAIDTIITQSAAGAGDSQIGVIQLSASGVSAADPVLLKNLRVAPVGMAGVSVGRFTQATGVNVAYVELNDVHVVGTNATPATEQERGLYVDLSSSLTNLVVSGSAFDNLSYGWYTHKSVSADVSTLRYVTVSGTTFNHCNLKGIYAEKLSDATFTGCTISGNGYDSAGVPSYFLPFMCGVDVNLKAGTYANLAFNGCTITGNGLGGAKEGVGMAVKARGTGSLDTSYTAFPATVTNVTVSGCTITGNERGLRLGEPGKNNTTPTNVVVSGCTISGNVKTYAGSDGSIYGGVVNLTSAVANAANNNWGSPSGPTIAALNPMGTGDGVSSNVLFTPWVGRTTSVTSIAVAPYGPLGLDGPAAIGVDGDGAPGFGTSSLRAPSLPAATKYGFDPEVILGRPVLVGEIYSVTYLTKKAALHTVDANDWYFQFYTDHYVGAPGTWYGNRIQAEPYFSQNLTETAGAWNQWATNAGANNRLRFFDSTSGYFGSYTDGFLSDLTMNPTYTAQPINSMWLGVGSNWAATFNGQLDGVVVELVNGQTIRLDFVSGNGQVVATPALTGPINCGQTQTLAVSLTKTAGMPDVFGFSAVVRATGPISWGSVTSSGAFGATTQFLSMNQGDGSYLISGTTTGLPTQPITGLGTTQLFTVQYTPTGTGTANISFDSFSLRDPNNAPIPVVATGTTFAIDCTAPAAVTAITAAPGHNKVNVGWTYGGSEPVTYEIYRGLWTNGTPGVSAYPEYDDLTGDMIPGRPATRAAAASSTAWVLAGTAPLGATTFLDSWADAANRGVYYYEVFAVDAANNPSLPAAANKRATNYWLGDVVGAPSVAEPNGFVNVQDMTALGTWFGTASVALNSAASPVDVGPTDNFSRLGIPDTDSKINFEDLMIFAMNFGVVTAAKSDAIVGTSVDLAWVRYDDGSMALRLVDGNGLKGVRVTANKPVGTLRAGGLLDEQSELTFAQNIGETLDANVAVMGVNTTFTGTGDLFVIPAGEAIELSDLTITARAIDNSKMEVKLTSAAGGLATPRAFALNGNYPNPFNPMTKISFSLPETQHVRLTVYGLDGRKVATLLDETRGAGLHEIVWTGRDDAGQSVASGTYFYRVDAGPYSDVRKMTLMK
jgi:hypothetical protein